MGKNLFRINISNIFAISEEGIKDRVKGRSLRAYSDALRHNVRSPLYRRDLFLLGGFFNAHYGK